MMQLGHGSELPDAPPPEYEKNEDFLRATHHVLLEVATVHTRVTWTKYNVQALISNEDLVIKINLCNRYNQDNNSYNHTW